MSVVYLGEYSSNPKVTCVYVHDEPLSWLGIGENKGSTQDSLNIWKVTSTSGVHWKACFSSVSLVSGFATLAKPDISRL
jgi:predicted NAD/FAD-dependent oxidoreductase